MISQEFLNQLSARHDIVDIVSRRVTLKKAGKEFAACCPFHTEKTPSFTVSASKQFYHCFGCGAHGGVFDFLIEYDGLNFLEAVEQLAQQAGMTVPRATRAQVDVDALAPARKALDAVQALYVTHLPLSAVASDYVSARGILPAIQAQFGIGFATGQETMALKLPQPALMAAGLLSVNEESGEIFAKFRQRLMFPIHDENGRVIAFGGRILSAKGTPKYLNSPETPLFSKGKELYGLNHARSEIRKERIAVVFEGYMDVVMAHQYGEQRAVAALGTSVTVDQVTRLFRMADEIVFCFDGDAAGNKAADRAAELILPIILEGKRARFVTLPSEHDPDSFLRAYGLEGWNSYLQEHGLPLSRKLARLVLDAYDLSLPEDLACAARKAKDIVEQITNAQSYRQAMANHFEKILEVKLGHAPTAPTRAPGQDSKAGGKVSVYRQNLHSAYAQLWALSPERAATVPASALDDFDFLIACWFAIAPASLADAKHKAAAEKNEPLSAVLCKAFERVIRIKSSFSPSAIEREADGLYQQVLGCVTADKRRTEITALLNHAR